MIIPTCLQTLESLLTFGHLNEASVVIGWILVLQGRGVFNETCLLWRALVWALQPRRG